MIASSFIAARSARVSEIELIQNQWLLDRVLSLDYQIPQQYFHDAPNGLTSNFRYLLSRDVYSEGDAQILYDYLLSRQDELSSDFVLMLNLWLEDELKHYEALRRTYHCLAGVTYSEMDLQFCQRVHNLKPIETLLEDEFTILVTLMFDEIGSVYSYRRDLAEYYSYFGSSIRQIAHHLIKDEGSHFSNAAELVLLHHSSRLDEVPAVLQKIIALEENLDKYHKVFFLDHAQEKYCFPANFNQVIARVILARLGLKRSPKQSTLRQLWQWTPPGQSYTPV